MDEWGRTFDAVPDLIMVLDNKHRIVRANKAIADRLGCTPGELVGRTCYKAIHGTEEPPGFCPHAHLLSDGLEHSAEVSGDRLKGHFLVSVSPHRHPDGTIGSVLVARDITSRKRADEASRKSERELRIRNRIAETFLTTSDDETYGEVLEVVLEAMRSKYGTFAFINEKGERVVPSMTRGIWDKCEVPGKTIVFPRETWGDNLWARCLIEKKAITSKGPFKVPEGHIPITRVLAVPIIHRGEAIGNFMVGNKVSDYDETDEELLKTIAAHTAPILHARLQRDRQQRDRQKAEKELRKARDELELRVKERTAELRNTVTELEKEIKDRKQAQEMAARVEQRYLTVADFTYDWEYWLGTERELLYVSPSCERITGYKPEEFLTKDHIDLISIVHPDDREDVVAHIVEDYKSDTTGHIDFRIVRRSGETRWISHYCQPVYGSDGEWLGRRASNRDITSRKKAEEALQQSEKQLRLLSTQLLKVQESERKRISRELHDSTGQSLTAIKFGLENAISSIFQDSAEESIELLQALIPVVQQASEEVRQIHTDLRPSLLDDLGIISTISWFCREFEKVYSAIKIEKEMDIEEKEVPEPLKIVIFRVLQEALNNISKYGKANHVRISLKGTTGNIEFVVEDNGQGFDIEHMHNVKSSKRGFGLTSMKERIELSGGAFAIESTPGVGTVVRASWPI
ncbi:MAG: PAS domain S-box protein [Deltaproteobacteria bacterium]|nr:PAS domain S-box protein [Deltaproteobacteria bacterium]